MTGDGAPVPEMSMAEAAVLHDAVRGVLAHLRGEKAWLRSDDSREHFSGMVDVLGSIAADALVAAGEARGLRPARARAKAIAQMHRYLDGAGLLMIADGVSPEDPRFAGTADISEP